MPGTVVAVLEHEIILNLDEVADKTKLKPAKPS